MNYKEALKIIPRQSERIGNMIRDHLRPPTLRRLFEPPQVVNIGMAIAGIGEYTAMGGIYFTLAKSLNGEQGTLVDMPMDKVALTAAISGAVGLTILAGHLIANRRGPEVNGIAAI